MTDRELGRQGFHQFSGSARSSDGGAVLFSYPSGAVYMVPLDYVLQWSHGAGTAAPVGGLTLRRTRRLPDAHFVRIYLSDGTSRDIAWDTVLMACEPRYEHYGGLTEQSKTLTREWAPKGPFRLKD